MSQSPLAETFKVGEVGRGEQVETGEPRRGPLKNPEQVMGTIIFVVQRERQQSSCSKRPKTSQGFKTRNFAFLKPAGQGKNAIKRSVTCWKRGKERQGSLLRRYGTSLTKICSSTLKGGGSRGVS